MLRVMSHLLIVLAAVALGVPENAARGQSQTVIPSAHTKDQRPRVIVRVRRSIEVSGYVELEDDDVIVIRKLDGELESYVKDQVIRILHLIDPEEGQRGTVVLRNGQRSAGTVVEDSFKQVVITVEGVAISFRRDTVDHIIMDPTFSERYNHFKKSIGPGTPMRHLELCSWLVDQRRYALASEELAALLKHHGDLPEALRLQRLVTAQLAMRVPRDDPAPEKVASPDEPNTTPDRKSGSVNMKDLIPDELLSATQVNLMRVYEINFRERPKVIVPPNTIRTMLENYGSNKLLPATAAERTAMFRADPLDIVRIMFQLRCRELYDQIEVLSEPRALNLFRQRVHNTWLMNSCATSRCHGGPYAGRLFLHRDNYRNERVRYTNLLILERLEINEEWPLVNYQTPTDSLIIQYGLPRSVARMPHPDVKGWKPVFSKNNQRLLNLAVEWIEAMMKPRPDYPVDYEPPNLKPDAPSDTAPTTAQADRPDARPDR